MNYYGNNKLLYHFSSRKVRGKKIHQIKQGGQKRGQLLSYLINNLIELIILFYTLFSFNEFYLLYRVYSKTHSFIQKVKNRAGKAMLLNGTRTASFETDLFRLPGF